MSHEAAETAETIERMTHRAALRQLTHHGRPGICIQPEMSLNCVKRLNCLRTPIYTRCFLRRPSKCEERKFSYVSVRVEFELSHLTKLSQLIDSTISQKRENRYFRRFGVRGGYTKAWKFNGSQRSGT